MFREDYITNDDRELIFYLVERGYRPKEICNQLYLSLASVDQTIKKGLTVDRGSLEYAIEDLAFRRNKYRTPVKTIPQEAIEIIESKIRGNAHNGGGWSPNSLARHFKEKDIKSTRDKTISVGTLYKYIWTDKELGGDLYKYLPNIAIDSESIWKTYDGPLKWMYDKLKNCFETSRKARLIYTDFDMYDLTTFIVWTPFTYYDGNNVIVDVVMNDDSSGEIWYCVEPHFVCHKGLFKAKLGFSREQTLEDDVLEYAKAISNFCNNFTDSRVTNEDIGVYGYGNN